jgi:dienelactone hydrolase
MPHAYGALLFLSAHPRIDPARIGTMGFSWGGVMSLFAASEEITRQYAGGRARFAAHLGIYPVCWAHLATFSGKNPSYDPGTYRMLTGAPVHILAGDKDDYDDPDTCQKFVDALPDDARRAVRVTVYPGAYHSWDRPGASAWTVHDANAYKGRGGMVRSQADQEIASRSRQFAVEFFTTQLVQKQ